MSTHDGIVVRKVEDRYEWGVAFYRNGCVLRGFFTYKRPTYARRAAKRALARLFDRGDMV
jgi:hypothetical protein